MGRWTIVESTEVTAKGPFQIDVHVSDDYASQVSATWLKGVVERTLALEEAPSSSAVDVVVVDDETVRELNSRHRGLDETTDVLAFSYVGGGEYYGEVDGAAGPDRGGEFVLPPGQKTGLGEVVVSYPQARRQAAERGHSTQREMAALLTHGVLHLLGYDHMEDDERVEMERREARVLSGGADWA
jgi:probable rRNA maturation factor